MSILNYTTKIDSYKTIAEIQKILSVKGAQKIIMDNDQAGTPIGLTFIIDWNGPVAFSLPCKYEGVLNAMKRDKKVPRSACTMEQALRVGWRILKNWIEAQLAIVESEMAYLPEVFLPYAVTKTQRTLFDHISGDSSLLLVPPKN